MTRQAALGWMALYLLTAAALRLPNLPHQPPGLHYDEAANVVLVGEIAFGGERPVFIASYTGKEVLFFYLAAGNARLLGNSVFAMRLTSAFLGLLTVAATYRLGREMLRNRRVALLAAVLLATSFWHLTFSRYGFRAISQPLLQALAALTLVYGLRRDSWPALVAAGLLLGLTAYTYLAARLFPLLLAPPLLLFLWRATDRRRALRQLALVAAVALVAAAPLVRYFWLYPDTFWVRIGQVAPGQPGSLSVVQSYLKSLAMLFISGDPYVRFNLPDRPLFSPWWGALLVLGWLLTWGRLRRAAAWEAAAALLLLLAPPVMLLPTALAVNEIVPSNLRAIGLIPFLFYLPALGLAWLLDRARAFSFARWRYGGVTLWPAVLGLILLSGGLHTARLYFGQWAGRADLYYESDSDLVEVARYLDQARLGEGRAYLAALHYRHPTVAALSRSYNRLLWLPGSQALVMPADGPALYVFPRNSPAPEWAAAYLTGATQVTGPDGPDGRPTFVAYWLAAPAPVRPAEGASASIGGIATVLGYEVGEAAAGEGLPVTLYWRIDRPPSVPLRPYLHLEDAWGYRWSQAEPDAYPSEQWQPGDLIVQRVEIPVRPGAPPGNYRLRAGLFDPADGRALPRLDEAGRYAGSAFTIERVAITAGAPPAVLPQPAEPLNLAALPSLRLLGYERGALKAGQGEILWLALWWQATGPLPPLISRLELIRPDNTGLILANSQPVHGAYPFQSWTTPQFVIDHLTPDLSPGTPPGDYRLYLRLLDGAGETLLKADLGGLTVEATERLFNAPRPQYPLAATFAGEIGLLGYDMTATGPGRYHLSLVWQALAPPAADYTVFVHTLGPDGVCCVWQQDVMPRQGAYPTSRWLPGEVVVDDYEIALPQGAPAGTYPLEIGLYLADSGRRLLVTMPGTSDGDALYLRPLVFE